jgi:hypothetical protein
LGTCKSNFCFNQLGTWIGHFECNLKKDGKVMYAKSYIDKFFNSIDEYESKVELFRIAYREFEKSQNTLLNSKIVLINKYTGGI